MSQPAADHSPTSIDRGLSIPRFPTQAEQQAQRLRLALMAFADLANGRLDEAERRLDVLSATSAQTRMSLAEAG